jgi:hypothetical protein
MRRRRVRRCGERGRAVPAQGYGARVPRSEPRCFRRGSRSVAPRGAECALVPLAAAHVGLDRRARGAVGRSMSYASLMLRSAPPEDDTRDGRPYGAMSAPAAASRDAASCDTQRRHAGTSAPSRCGTPPRGSRIRLCLCTHLAHRASEPCAPRRRSPSCATACPCRGRGLAGACARGPAARRPARPARRSDAARPSFGRGPPVVRTRPSRRSDAALPSFGDTTGADVATRADSLHCAPRALTRGMCAAAGGERRRVHAPRELPPTLAWSCAARAAHIEGASRDTPMSAQRASDAARQRGAVGSPWLDLGARRLTGRRLVARLAPAVRARGASCRPDLRGAAPSGPGRTPLGDRSRVGVPPARCGHRRTQPHGSTCRLDRLRAAAAAIRGVRAHRECGCSMPRDRHARHASRCYASSLPSARPQLTYTSGHVQERVVSKASHVQGWGRAAHGDGGAHAPAVRVLTHRVWRCAGAAAPPEQPGRCRERAAIKSCGFTQLHDPGARIPREAAHVGRVDATAYAAVQERGERAMMRPPMQRRAPKRSRCGLGTAGHDGTEAVLWVSTMLRSTSPLAAAAVCSCDAQAVLRYAPP